ncbi:MAG: hypothetical protein HC851_10725 [Acaryochloris sp. RU_4_1]|nr:hypothetical protein [Acaryochloris sp. RU_4_1]NJR54637.1 hypothetical protein [Acaryochloris sp. CRU_2_0]
MNIIQLTLLKNAGCAGGCKFCSLSVNSEVNRQIGASKEDFQHAYQLARQSNARLELVFPSVGANQREVINLIVERADVIRENRDIELAINPGICTQPGFYTELAQHGVNRYRNNLECSRRLFRELVPQRPLAQGDKLKSLAFAKVAGLKVDTGWLCGLGEEEADIQDIVELIHRASPDSITLNYFDPRESAETFNHTAPSRDIGLERLNQLRTAFPQAELTLGGAYEFWLGTDAIKPFRVDGVYMGRFLDHGLKAELMSSPQQMTALR